MHLDVAMIEVKELMLACGTTGPLLSSLAVVKRNGDRRKEAAGYFAGRSSNERDTTNTVFD